MVNMARVSVRHTFFTIGRFINLINLQKITNRLLITVLPTVDDVVFLQSAALTNDLR